MSRKKIDYQTLWGWIDEQCTELEIRFEEYRDMQLLELWHGGRKDQIHRLIQVIDDLAYDEGEQ